MNKRQKIDQLSEGPSKLRRTLDEQGWVLYDSLVHGEGASWPIDVDMETLYHWYLQYSVVIRGPTPHDPQNFFMVRLGSHAHIGDVFDFCIPSDRILSKIITNLQDLGCVEYKKYGWKSTLHLKWDFLICRTEFHPSPSFYYHEQLGLVYGQLTQPDRLDILEHNGTLVESREEYGCFHRYGLVALSKMKNLHVPFSQFCIKYLHIALECDSPILEAIWSTWPAGEKVTVTSSLPLFYERKENQLIQLPNEASFKRRYKS
jgi:hypothetical protein